MTPLAETIEASIHAPIERCLSQFDEARGVEVGPEAVDPAASQASSVSDASHEWRRPGDGATRSLTLGLRALLIQYSSGCAEQAATAPSP